MLTQLTRLSVQADGRYATTEELQFLQGYFQSFELRVSAYEKIRVAEEQVIDLVEQKMRVIDPNLFINAAGDFTENWRRDTVNLLRYSAATLLFNESDRLRNGILLWHNTITKSYKVHQTCKTCFEVMPEVVKQYLTPEEAALFVPILELNQIILG